MQPSLERALRHKDILKAYLFSRTNITRFINLKH